MAEAEGERQERLVIIVRRDLAAMRQLESTLEDAMQQAEHILGSEDSPPMCFMPPMNMCGSRIEESLASLRITIGRLESFLEDMQTDEGDPEAS